MKQYKLEIFKIKNCALFLPLLSVFLVPLFSPLSKPLESFNFNHRPKGYSLPWLNWLNNSSWNLVYMCPSWVSWIWVKPIPHSLKGFLSRQGLDLTLPLPPFSHVFKLLISLDSVLVFSPYSPHSRDTSLTVFGPYVSLWTSSVPWVLHVLPWTLPEATPLWNQKPLLSAYSLYSMDLCLFYHLLKHFFVSLHHHRNPEHLSTARP